MTHNPAKDVRDLLDSDATLGLTTGTNLFLGTQRAVGGNIPVDAVFIHGNSGIPPLRSMGEVAEVRRPLVNIRVRWSSFGPGDQKIRDIMNVLQASSVTTYLSNVLLTESEPLPLGQDEQGNSMWSLGCEIVYRGAA